MGLVAGDSKSGLRVEPGSSTGPLVRRKRSVSIGHGKKRTSSLGLTNHWCQPPLKIAQRISTVFGAGPARTNRMRAKFQSGLSFPANSARVRVLSVDFAAMRNLVLILLARHGIGYLVEPRARCSGPFWFAIGGHHLEELHGGSLNLNNVPSLQELALTIPSHYGRIWTNGRTVNRLAGFDSAGGAMAGMGPKPEAGDPKGELLLSAVSCRSLRQRARGQLDPQETFR